MSYHSMPKGPWGEPWGVTCKSCNLPIFEEQRSEEIKFPQDSESADMSGTYHAECARPFASLARALAMLGNWSR